MRMGIYNRLSLGHTESEQSISEASADESSKMLLIILSYTVLEGNTRRVRQHPRDTVFRPPGSVFNAFQLSQNVFETRSSAPLGHWQ